MLNPDETEVHMPASVRVALELSLLPSDEFDVALARLNSLPFDMWNDEQQVDQSVMVEELNTISARMSPEDKVEVSGMFHRDFQRTGNLAALQAAMGMLRQALDAPDRSDDVTRVASNNIAVMHDQRFDRTGDFADINACIDATRTVINMVAKAEDKAEGLYTLGHRLVKRFIALLERDDLVQALTAYMEGLSLLTADDEHRGLFKTKLITTLSEFIRTPHSPEQLSETINAIQSDSRIDADSRAEILGGTGEHVQTIYEQVGRLELLQDAVTVLRHALELVPDRSNILSSLGVVLLVRFERLGDLADLQTAVDCQQRASSSLNSDNPSRPGILHNLGNILQVRFSHTGHVEDLDEAINAHIQCVYSRDNYLTDVDKIGFYNSLGTAYHRRYDHLQNASDINSAVEAKGKAVELAPDGYPARAQLLNGHGSALLVRYSAFLDEEDLHEAVKAHRTAVELTPRDHATRVLRLHNLVQTLQTSFQALGRVEDIEDAITTAEEVVNLTPRDSIQRKAAAIFSLGICLKLKYTHSLSQADLNVAISRLKDATDILPVGVETSKFTSELAALLMLRFDNTADEGDLNDAIAALYLGAHTVSTPELMQFRAALHFAQVLAEHREPSHGTEAYTHVLELIPRIIWMGHDVGRRFEGIGLVRSAVSAAVAHALLSSQPTLALEWAEQGRCIVWNQVLQLRQPSDILEEVAPELAAELRVVTTELQTMGIQSRQTAHGAEAFTQFMAAITQAVLSQHPEDIPEGESVEDYSLRLAAFAVTMGDAQKQKQRRLTEKYEHLLAQAQALPGYDHFLRPKRFAELRGAARDGPVVLLNISSQRCDALVLVESVDDVIHVPLTTLTREIVGDMLSTFLGDLEETGMRSRSGSFSRPTIAKELRAVLGGLWTHVVDPILVALKDHLRKEVNHKLPRITWCTSGALTFLPLHAAGLYNIKNLPPDDALFNHVVSSYTPSITALLAAQHRSLSAPVGPLKLLAVSQPTTPNAEDLPQTVAEVEIVKKHVPGLTWINGSDGTRNAVLQALREHSWVHLACHGEQDLRDPLKSAFLLQDGSLELLDIMKESFSHTQLAFLSACRTAAGDERRPDEAVHLAAGMLMAGFRNVVATLWSIGDEDALFVAEHFYAHLVEEGDGDPARASEALHYATSKLRERVGEGRFLRWVPFIHIGA